MPEGRSPQILLVEDSPVVRRALENALRAAGYKVVSATTAPEALKAAFAQRPDLMILDLTLDTPTFDTFREGFAVLHWLRHMLRDARFPVIIHTADTSPLVDQRAREAGIFAVIRKGDTAKDILDVVREAIGKASPATEGSGEASAAA